MGLAGSSLRSITLSYHRLTVFLGNSKSVGGNSMGVRFPLLAPYIAIAKSLIPISL